MKCYELPINLRRLLANAYEYFEAYLIRGDPPEVMKRVKELLRSLSISYLWCVGDIVCLNSIKYGLEPYVCIVDGKTLRYEGIEINVLSRYFRYVVKVKVFDNETFSATSSYIVYIDCLEVDSIGYLIDEDSDGVYDVFHNSSSGLENSVAYKDDRYLIDVDGDNSWDYSFTVSSGLCKYIRTSIDCDKKIPDFSVSSIIALLFLMVIYFLRLRRYS